jgi:hypothetical protein
MKGLRSFEPSIILNQPIRRNIPQESCRCENLILQETFSIQTLKNDKHFNTNEDFSGLGKFEMEPFHPQNLVLQPNWNTAVY